MIEPQGAKNVKLLVAALWRDPDALKEARKDMEGRWGAIDFESDDYPFDATKYYEIEMGSGLTRRLLSFAGLVKPDQIVEIKRSAAAIEMKLARDGKRRINLDPGYLDPHKLVLASFKYGAMKIYMGSNVWAHIVSVYRRGGFHPSELTFADFKDNRYERDLLAIRERYRVDLQAMAANGRPA